MKRTTTRLALSGLLSTGLLVPATGRTQTQIPTAKQFSACYVPATGTVYLIKQPGLRSECAPGHVQFSWSDGGSSPAVTPAVVITDPDGWAATGTFGSGVIPVTGAGVRLMWYPRKGAFRAGGVSGTQWDDANVGNYSIAMGTGTMATASRSTALGQNTTASGSSSTALGLNTTASGAVSTAMGAFASTNLRQGSFVYGDLSTSASGALVEATSDNSFVVRASGGLRFRTSPDLTTGCDISGAPSAGRLTCSDIIHAAAGGFQFPDGSVQTTAATSGGSASDVVCTGCVGTSDLANGAVTAPKLGPLSDLVLSGTSAFNGLRIVNSSPTGTERIDFIDATGSTIAGVQVGNTSPSRMAIFNNRPGASVLMATGGLDRLTVTATGSVGIGTSTPASKLTVTGMIESTSGGVKFPDGTVQTRAGAVSGYQVVHVAFNQPNGGAGSPVVNCPAGKRPMGGGVDKASNAVLQGDHPVVPPDFPTFNGWVFIFGPTTNGAAASSDLYVVCVNAE